MTGAYLGNTLLAYSPDASTFDRFRALGYEVKPVPPQDLHLTEGNNEQD